MKKLSDIQYLCIDLDGTLLTSSKTIDDVSACYLNECIKKGLHIILVSGRHFFEIEPYIKRLGLNSNEFVISCDGEYIYKCSGELQWYSPKLDYGDIKIIGSRFKKTNFTIIRNDENIVVTHSLLSLLRSNFISWITRSNTKFCTKTDKYLRNLRDIEKIVMSKTSYYNCKDLKDMYCVHDLDEGRIEILPKKVNKYEALIVLEGLGGVNLDAALYFGNDMNDQECFDNLKYCIAMGDSSEYIKKKAFYITGDCDNQGVTQAIHKIIF